MTTSDRCARELLPFLESDVRRLEVDLEFARERLRRCVEEIEEAEREAERRAARPTVRVRRRPNTLPAFEALPPTPPSVANAAHRGRGATRAFGAMPLPTPLPVTPDPEPSGIREIPSTRLADERDPGRYEFVAELTRKRAHGSARFTGGSR